MLSPDPLEVELNYLAPMKQRPYIYAFDAPAGVEPTNLVLDRRLVPIYNARPLRLDFNRVGFSLLTHTSAVENFFDPAEIRRTYYPEVEHLLSEATGADHAVVFDHTVRRRVPGAEDRKHQFRQPVELVHVDYSDCSAPRRVRDILATSLATSAVGRIQVVNVWRSLRNALRDAPLAVCDASSVAETDRIAADLVYPSGPSEVLLIEHNPEHRWFYFPEMNANEALVFKCYDSQSDNCGRFTPHSAFTDPTALPGVPARESIELRVVLAYRDAHQLRAQGAA